MSESPRMLALRHFTRSAGLAGVVGVACGLASGLFLFLLEVVTDLRAEHRVLVDLLPVGGLVIGALYGRWGKPIEGGSGLVVDTIHRDGPTLPLRMAPMVLVGTVLTHLFGGSAGREGTAVQMGASLADGLASRLSIEGELRRELLVAGVAGGFGSVFGTPIAGALFGMEVVVLGRLELRALVPALTASIVGDWVTRAVGIHHTPYPAAPALALSPLVLAKWAVFAVAIAAATIAFIALTHRLAEEGKRRVPSLALRMGLGGLAVLALATLVGTDDYLGLGVPTIVRAFEDPALPRDAFALKLIFTAVTLGAGFLGGEVTPLFFVGATLGNVMARLLDLPLGLGAAVGMAALFGAAANTPIALSVMAVELVGADVLPHVLVVAVIAYLLTGHRSIYKTQRVLVPKLGAPLPEPVRLDEVPRAASGEEEDR